MNQIFFQNAEATEQPRELNSKVEQHIQRALETFWDCKFIAY